MQYQKPVLVQEQRLKMNPQLYQSIQLMALPIQDLKLRIHEELEANPALDVVEDQSTVSLDERTSSEQGEEYEYFENSSDPGYSGGGYDEEAAENKRRFMEGALSRSESLQDHLLWQLRLQPITAAEFTIGELLIHNLDENGFDREAPGTLIAADDESVLERMRRLIQGFEPIGTCVADYRESLLVQARAISGFPQIAEPIIEHHLDLVERDRLPELARRLKAEVEDVNEAVEFIKGLNPFPGRLFSSEQPTYVTPDLMVVHRDGQYVIIMNDEELPVLGVNDSFTDVVHQDGGNTREVKRFINAKVKDARWFIRSIHQRNQTLMKVARAIVEFQRDFFYRGPKYLVPLTLKDIAAEVGVHEATVSRITTAKYVQTEWGIFELKYFFTNSISGAGSSGSRYSKEAVKEIIREILEDKATERHLSDQGISDLLAQRGIKLARRTVAKYRKELDISSSYHR